MIESYDTPWLYKYNFEGGVNPENIINFLECVIEINNL